LQNAHLFCVRDFFDKQVSAMHLETREYQRKVHWLRYNCTLGDDIIYV
jgi:hypothetical protein